MRRPGRNLLITLISVIAGAIIKRGVSGECYSRDLRQGLTATSRTFGDYYHRRHQRDSASTLSIARVLQRQRFNRYQQRRTEQSSPFRIGPAGFIMESKLPLYR